MRKKKGFTAEEDRQRENAARAAQEGTIELFQKVDGRRRHLLPKKPTNQQGLSCLLRNPSPLVTTTDVRALARRCALSHSPIELPKLAR